MIKIQNMIAECMNPHAEIRRFEDLRYLMIHRFGWPSKQDWVERDLTLDAVGCRDFYRDNPEARAATGGEMPYTFVVRHDGQIDQAAMIGAVTPHARRFNNPAIGIGVLGDFQITPPTDQQILSLEDLCAMLINHWSHLKLVGHSEFAGAASPGKICPGEYLRVADIRDHVHEMCRSWSGQRLLDAGAVF